MAVKNLLKAAWISFPSYIDNNYLFHYALFHSTCIGITAPTFQKWVGTVNPQSTKEERSCLKINNEFYIHHSQQNLSKRLEFKNGVLEIVRLEIIEISKGWGVTYNDDLEMY